jgi:hypothetical protein
MGKRFLQSISSEFQTLTASADIQPVDLPVNPISHLILKVQGTQTTRATAGLYSYLHDFCAAFSDISVRHRGETVLQGSLADLHMLTAFLTGYFPFGTKPDGDVGKIRSMAFLLPFGRKPFWEEEAFPATTRGNLRFHATAGALPASFSAVSWSLETVELIEADPKRHIKATTITHTPSATGFRRIQLPIGNDILGVQLADPTVVTGDPAAYNPSRIMLLKDNVQQYFTEVDWESLMVSFGIRGAIPMQLGGHIHFAGQAVAAEVEENEQNKSEVPMGYAYLDFDPRRDGYYALETKGAATLDLNVSMDTGSGTSRIMPVELVTS